jgi:hypothetical protein
MSKATSKTQEIHRFFTKLQHDKGSYVFVEEVTKDRVAINPKPSPCDHTRSSLALLYDSFSQGG